MLFQVEYKPQVSLTAERQELYEGDSVKMRCEASAWPALVEFTWQVGGEEVEEARGATELILQADRRLAGQRVTCLARNKIGQASADYRLDIHCKISLISESDLCRDSSSDTPGSYDSYNFILSAPAGGITSHAYILLCF